MAGSPLGARAPESLPVTSSQSPTPQRVPATSRTRRVHGVFNLGAELAAIYSSRCAGEAQTVTLEVGDGLQRLTGSMTPAQARSMARALVVAAEVGENTQRRLHVERRAAPAHVAAADDGYYSALTPSGERVLLPVGTYFNRAGRLCGGAQ